MNNLVDFDNVKQEANRLLRYRYVLVIAMIVNGVLVAKVPLASPRWSAAGSDNTSQTMAAPPVETDSDPVRDASDDHRRDQIADPTATATVTTTQPVVAEPHGTTDEPLAGFVVIPPSERPPVAPFPRSDCPAPATTVAATASRHHAENQPIRPVLPAGFARHMWGLAKQSLKVCEDTGRWFTRQWFAAITTRKDQHPPTVTGTMPPPRSESQLPGNGSASVLVLQNPPSSGGAVRFLVGDHTVSLSPGEVHELPGDSSRLVRFHRGDSFGNAEMTLTAGHFAFQVTDHGWDLMPMDR